MTRPDEKRSVFDNDLSRHWSKTSSPMGHSGACIAEKTGIDLGVFHGEIPPDMILRRYKEFKEQIEKEISDGLLASFKVSPTVPNVLMPPAKYFRAVVWNLENFTGDSRPAGTTHVESARNMARSAIVADFAYRHGADVVLMMENGSDVGQAMTNLAQQWKAKEDKGPDMVKRSVEPLVSAATHGIPGIPYEVDSRIYENSSDTVRAMMLAGEGYLIEPDGFPGISLGNFEAALDRLYETSNHFETLEDRPAAPTKIGDGKKPIWVICDWCAGSLIEGFDVDFGATEDWSLIGNLLNAILSDFSSYLAQPASELGTVRRVILTIRELNAATPTPNPVSAVLEVLEMALLADLIVRGLGTTEFPKNIPSPSPPSEIFGKAPDVLLPDTRMLWRNSAGQPADLVSTALFLACGQRMKLTAHDADNGPMFTSTDGELLLNALVRLKVVGSPKSETYGFAYRPFTNDHLAAFLNRGFSDLGMSTAGIYGILHAGKNGQMVASQEPRGVLAGRSALVVNFPFTPKQDIPFCLFHNRFSETKRIKEMDDDYQKGVNAIRGRMLTVENMATVLSGADKGTQPLLVGDFNTPAEYIEEEAGGTRKNEGFRQRKATREQHKYKMAFAGYLRRTSWAHTNPRTSLKANFSLAIQKDCLNQPYDAVYQPFDFLRGRAKVQSAAVTQARSFFPPELVGEVIKYKTAKGEPRSKRLSILIIREIHNTYKGLIKLIIANISGSSDWLKGKKFEDGGAAAFLAADISALAFSLATREETFVDGIKGNLYVEGIIADDPVIQKYLSAIAAVEGEVRKYLEAEDKERKAAARKKSKKRAKSSSSSDDDPGASKGKKIVRRKKAAHERLGDIADLFLGLKNLESSSERRFWCAYRKLVSDHVPIVVEVEML